MRSLNGNNICLILTFVTSLQKQGKSAWNGTGGRLSEVELPLPAGFGLVNATGKIQSGSNTSGEIYRF